MKYFLLAVFSFLLLHTSLLAQQVPVAVQNQAMAELKNRGLNEEDVRQRLLARGIDIDNVTMDQLPQLQSTIEQVIQELEAEKAEKERTQQAENPQGGQMDTPTSQEGGATQPVQTTTPAQGGEVINGTVAQTSSQNTPIANNASKIPMDLSDNMGGAPEPTTTVTNNIRGQELFQSNAIGFARESSNVNPSGSYTLSAGDIIHVSIFGTSQYDARFEINSEGYIQPSNMKKIFLKGVPLSKAVELVRSRFSRFYTFSREQFAVSLSSARLISVNIFGEVKNNGTFSLPGVNTAFNALVAAGGPTAIGSVRNIKIIRGKSTKLLDVYEFMTNPSVQFDYYLEENDIVYVPIAEKVVKISGAVNRPLRYELKAEEQLIKLIDYAGGFQPNAYKNIIQIKRYEEDQEVLLDVPLKQLLQSNSDFFLQNGDEVSIKTIPSEVDNFAIIEGEVEYPGNYSLNNTPTISSLLEKGILLKEARQDVAFLVRKNTDGTNKLIQLDLQEIINNPNSNANLKLEKEDKLITYPQARFVDQSTIKVTGAVRDSLEYPFAPDSTITLQQAVLLAGGLKPEARDIAYIIRTHPENILEKEYVEVNIKEALSNPLGAANISLQPLDELKILSTTSFTDAYTVSTIGQVRTPSEFQYAESLRVRDLVLMSGGLKPEAKAETAYIIRTNAVNIKEKEYIKVNLKEAITNPTSSENIKIQPLDQLKILSKLTFIDEAYIRISGAVRQPGEFKYAESLKLKDLITLSGGLKLGAALNRLDIYRLVMEGNTATRTIVTTLEVDSLLQTINGLEQELSLEPYDEVVVRSIPEFEFQKYVALEGAVKYPGRYALLNDNEPLSSIIKRAGGLTSESFAAGAILTRREDNIGLVVTHLDKALKDPKSKFNYILKDGDLLSIPESKDLVSIKIGNTRAVELYPQDFLVGRSSVTVAYDKGKRANWYIKEYAVGYGDNANRKKVTVKYPNGELKRTKSFLFFKSYPRVEAGSVVSVGYKPPKVKEPKVKKERNPVDWEKVLANTFQAITLGVTTVLLVKQL